MPFDLFKGLIDEIADKIYFVNLYNWGEPLLHPKIFDMVDYATARGLSVRISSNLNRMTSDHARLMVESGLEELLVDVDGAKQDTYAAYRVRGELSTVIENLRELAAVKKERGSDFPLITARTLVNRQNESELEAIEALVWDLGVDRFDPVPIYVDWGNPGDVSKWVPTSQQQSPPVYSGQLKKCVYLWRNLTVSWDGGVFPCCWFHQAEYDFGNVVEDGGLLAVWNNENYVTSRSFLAGKSDQAPATICGRCRGYPEFMYSYSNEE
jgi:radical SAM protein with 4Fe4S-binding SPASM domain